MISDKTLFCRKERLTVPPTIQVACYVRHLLSRAPRLLKLLLHAAERNFHKGMIRRSAHFTHCGVLFLL